MCCLAQAVQARRMTQGQKTCRPGSRPSKAGYGYHYTKSTQLLRSPTAVAAKPIGLPVSSRAYCRAEQNTPAHMPTCDRQHANMRQEACPHSIGGMPPWYRAACPPLHPWNSPCPALLCAGELMPPRRVVSENGGNNRGHMGRQHAHASSSKGHALRKDTKLHSRRPKTPCLWYHSQAKVPFASKHQHPPALETPRATKPNTGSCVRDKTGTG